MFEENLMHYPLNPGSSPISLLLFFRLSFFISTLEKQHSSGRKSPQEGTCGPSALISCYLRLVGRGYIFKAIPPEGVAFSVCVENQRKSGRSEYSTSRYPLGWLAKPGFRLVFSLSHGDPPSHSFLLQGVVRLMDLGYSAMMPINTQRVRDHCWHLFVDESRRNLKLEGQALLRGARDLCWRCQHLWNSLSLSQCPPKRWAPRPGYGCACGWSWFAFSWWFSPTAFEVYKELRTSSTAWPPFIMKRGEYDERNVLH